MTELEVRESVHGRGVFALRAFRKSEVIQRCPVMVVPPAERRYQYVIRALDFYGYAWSEPHWPEEGMAICLGYGSLFNDSDDPNVSWIRDPDSARTLVFSAKRDIVAGEELTHRYNWSDEHAKIGFGPADIDGLPIQEPIFALTRGTFAKEGDRR